MKTKDDYDWFLSANLNNYKGKHIAIINQKVIASGTNPKEVWMKAHKKYHPIDKLNSIRFRTY